jgi:hypothetical protein
MSKRGSLVSGSDFESIGRGRGARSHSRGGGPSSQDKIKISVAAGLLVVAALLLAWNFGLFTRAPYVEPVPPEVVAELEETRREYDRKVEEGIIPPPSLE